MKDEKLDPHLGRRVIAETRLVRNEQRIERAINKALAFHRRHALKVISTQHLTAAVPPDPFGSDTWDSSVDEFVMPVVNDVLTGMTSWTFNFLKLPPDMRARLLGEIDVESRTANFVNVVRTVGPNVSTRLMEQLSVGVNQGESMDQLSKRITDSFSIAENNAARIARTETHGAAESTVFDSASAVHDAGLTLTKTWIAQGGARPTHAQAEADNVKIPMDQPFIVGGSECDFPGNTGDPGEDINCRCSAVYQTD